MRLVLPAVLVSLLACTGTSASTTTSASDTSSDTTTATDATGDAAAAAKRNKRYCEVLLGTLGAVTVHIDVYSTEGLNDCPDAAWQGLDTAAIKTSTGADIVVLNGPRYWMLDSLAGSSLQGVAVTTFGTIDMRKAGQIDVPTAGMASMSKPYVQHTIHRESAFHWLAGQAVYELHDPQGHAYAMQSYSAQKQALTVTDLPGLTAKLTAMPAGWTYAPRTLEKDLDLLATAGDATVVQDELGNTYSME